jgi:hypothetical protein
VVKGNFFMAAIESDGKATNHLVAMILKTVPKIAKKQQF